MPQSGKILIEYKIYVGLVVASNYPDLLSELAIFLNTRTRQGYELHY